MIVIKEFIWKKSTLPLLIALLLANAQNHLFAQDPYFVKKNEHALEEMIKRSPKLRAKIRDAKGYIVLGRVNNNAEIGIGGSSGKGTVYYRKKITGICKMDRMSKTVDLGGSQYSELILFDSEETYNKFIEGKLKFGKNILPITLNDKVNYKDLKFVNGVLVFTLAKGELIYLPTIKGQKFKFTSLEDISKDDHIPYPPSIEDIEE